MEDRRLKRAPIDEDLDYEGLGTQALTDQIKKASVIIWTTTPWTIPQNRAICFNPTLSYGLYDVTEAADDNWAKTGDRYLLADNLAEEVFKSARVDGFKRVRDVETAELEAIHCTHPLNGQAENGEWDYDVPMLPGDHVTDEAGTGFVHTAPSHGADDYVIGQNPIRIPGVQKRP